MVEYTFQQKIHMYVFKNTIRSRNLHTTAKYM